MRDGEKEPTFEESMARIEGYLSASDPPRTATFEAMVRRLQLDVTTFPEPPIVARAETLIRQVHAGRTPAAPFAQTLEARTLEEAVSAAIVGRPTSTWNPRTTAAVYLALLRVPEAEGGVQRGQGGRPRRGQVATPNVSEGARGRAAYLLRRRKTYCDALGAFLRIRDLPNEVWEAIGRGALPIARAVRLVYRHSLRGVVTHPDALRDAIAVEARELRSR